jgi:hypothetical protein
MNFLVDEIKMSHTSINIGFYSKKSMKTASNRKIRIGIKVKKRQNDPKRDIYELPGNYCCQKSTQSASKREFRLSEIIWATRALVNHSLCIEK